MAKKKPSFICHCCKKEYFEQDCNTLFKKGIQITVVCPCGAQMDVAFKKTLILRRIYSKVIDRGQHGS